MPAGPAAGSARRRRVRPGHHGPPSGHHRILGRGECFGALAAPGQPRAEPEGVAAVTDSVLFVVSRNEFAGLVEACPIFGARFSSNGSFVLRRRAHERAESPELAMREVG